MVGAVGLAIALAGFLVNYGAIRGEGTDRKKAMEDAWAREWAAQQPLVYPRLPSNRGAGSGPYLKLKNGGRGPALNVVGKLTYRHGAHEPWGEVSTGALAAGDEEVVEIAGPRETPPWPFISGELRYQDLVGGLYVTPFVIETARDGESLTLTFIRRSTSPRSPLRPSPEQRRSVDLRSSTCGGSRAETNGTASTEDRAAGRG